MRQSRTALWLGLTALAVVTGCGQIDLPDGSALCINDGGCWVSDTCYLADQEMPGNRCQTCMPGTSDNGFTKTQCPEAMACAPESGECVTEESGSPPDAVGDGSDVTTTDTAGPTEGDSDVTPTDTAGPTEGDSDDSDVIPTDTAGPTEGDSDAVAEDAKPDAGPGPVECDEAQGLVATCKGTCGLQSALGDGQCDAAFACQSAEWDDGDCASECPQWQIPDCNQGCFWEQLKGDGLCSEAFQCEGQGWDGGDCCADSEIESCDGDCVPASQLVDDDLCDPVFQCSKHSWDVGNCDIICPAGETLRCDGLGCLKADLYANGTCNAKLNCDAQQWDGGDCCPQGMMPICDTCIETGADNMAQVGDGACHPLLSCADTDFDGGDCEPSCPGLDLACPGQPCVQSGWLGDGICDPQLACEEFALDGGDCCPDLEQRKLCDGSCATQAEIDLLELNGTCDQALACPDLSWDQGQCCPPGELQACNGQCIHPTNYANGACNMGFACEAYAMDGGDCESACAGDMLPSCEGSPAEGPACVLTEWLGDGQCNAELNCEANNWDQTDCCADDPCQASEEVQCPENCEPICPNDASLSPLLVYGPAPITAAGQPPESDATLLADVVMDPHGAYYAAWFIDQLLVVSKFPAALPPSTPQGQQQSWYSSAPPVSAPPAIALSSTNRIAVTFRREASENAPAAIVLRRNTGAWDASNWETTVLSEGEAFQGIPQIAWGPEGKLFIAGLESLGNSKRPVVLRIGGDGKALSAAAEPMDSGGAVSNYPVGIASAPDGTAYVSWVSPGHSVNGEVINPEALIVQPVTIDGDFGDPTYIGPPTDSGSAFSGSPALDISPAGHLTVIVATQDPPAMWMAKLNTQSPEAPLLEQWLEFGATEALPKLGVNSSNLLLSPYDIAVNGDGWGLVTISFQELNTRLYRLPPSPNGAIPPPQDWGSVGGLPRIGAATCFDDAVVMTAMSGTAAELQRVRLLGDDDGDGAADQCCQP
jgi:hypothetical protein